MQEHTIILYHENVQLVGNRNVPHSPVFTWSELCFLSGTIHHEILPGRIIGKKRIANFHHTMLSSLGGAIRRTRVDIIKYWIGRAPSGGAHTESSFEGHKTLSARSFYSFFHRSAGSISGELRGEKVRCWITMQNSCHAIIAAINCGLKGAWSNSCRDHWGSPSNRFLFTRPPLWRSLISAAAAAAFN